MSQFLRSNYSDFFSADALPVLEEVFRSELSMHPSRREALFKVVSTEKDIWQSAEIHDMPMLSIVPEGSEYSFQRPKQGASATATPVKYGLGFKISEEAVEDGKMDFVSDAIRKMARSARESQEINAMNIFNNGFSTELTADGVALFSASHTLPSGGSVRNVLSTASDLSVTSLEQMLEDFETQFVGDSGIIYNIKPRNLVVHPSQKRYAMELIGSDLKADSADNNMNSLKSDGLRVISSPHLTDTDAWFLTSDVMEHGLRIVSRKPIETKAAGPDVGFVNDSILYKVRYREDILAIHPFGVFGTAGE